MSSGNDYNWAMTGPPTQQEILGDPNAVVSYNNYVQAVQNGTAESNGNPAALSYLSASGAPVPPVIAQQFASSTPGVNLTGAGQSGAGQSAPAQVSQLDALAGAKLVGTEGNAQGQTLSVYLRPDGSRIYVDQGIIQYATPPYSAYSNPEDVRQGYRNQNYSTASAYKNKSTININGIELPVAVPEYLVNDKGQVLSDQSGNPVTIQQVTPRPGPSGLGQIVDTLAPSLILGAVTMGFGSLAAPIGSAVLSSLGASTALASEVGAAIVGSGTQAFLAAANGQDPTKAAIRGAITAGVAAGTTDLLAGAANFIGNGDPISGMWEISSVADAIGQTPTQVARMITNAAGATIAAAATGQQINATTLINNLASTAIGNYAGNLVKSADLGTLVNAAPYVSQIAKVSASALLNGQDIGTALTNNAGQIVGNLVNQGISTTVSAIKDAAKSTSSEAQNATLTSDSDGTLTTKVEIPKENYDRAEQLAKESGNKQLLDAVHNKNTDVINTLSLGGFSATELIDKALSSLMSSAQAAPNPQPDNPNAREAYYTQQNGNWYLVVDDLNGNQKIIGVSPQGGQQPVEDEKSGLWYDVGTANSEGGYPTPLTPQTTQPSSLAGEPTAEEQAQIEKELAAAAAKDDAAIAAQKEAESGATSNFNPNLDAALQFPTSTTGQTTATLPADIVAAVEKTKSLVNTGTPINDAIATVSQITGVSSTDISNNLATSAGGAGTSTTDSGTFTTASTSTGTQGGGALTGDSTSGGTIGGETGTGIGGGTGTATTGTGTGTTGSGTGDTGTGTGGSGTGTGSGGGTGTGTGGTGTGGTGTGGTGTGGTGTGGTGTGGTGTGGTGTGGTGTGGTGTVIKTPTTPKVPTSTTTATTSTTPEVTDSGIVNLVGGVSLGNQSYSLFNPAFRDYGMEDTSSILGFAAGGSSTTDSTDNSVVDIAGLYGKFLSGAPKLTAGIIKPNLNYDLIDHMPEKPMVFQYAAEGGAIGEHQPEFFSEGGLSSIQNRYVKGEGDGTSDSVPAMLADGEFVIPADVVSSLGNGSNEAGASVLDEFLKTIRKHKRRADAKHLPPDSKGPLAYLLEAHKKVGN